MGKLQFAASLHWLRASEQSICKARFDYAMALAACVGATTPEVIGMYGCKVKKVKQSCRNYAELCRYLDLPTLEEMAIKDARSVIRQWSIYEPSDFLWNMSMEQLVCAVSDKQIKSDDPGLLRSHLVCRMQRFPRQIEKHRIKFKIVQE